MRYGFIKFIMLSENQICFMLRRSIVETTFAKTIDGNALKTKKGFS